MHKNLFLILFCLGLFILGFNLYKIILWYFDNHKINTIQKEISEVIIPNKIPVYSENINPPENERAAAGSCYQRRTGGRPVRRNPGAGGHQCHRRPDPG